MSDPNVPAGAVMGINSAKFTFWRNGSAAQVSETPGDALVDAVSAIRIAAGLPVRKRRVSFLDAAISEYIKRNAIS